MTKMPKLLNEMGGPVLPRRLFSDLCFDQIISETAISVLQSPCSKNEIARRADLFRRLEDPSCLDKLQGALTACVDCERAYRLQKDAKSSLERLHLRTAFLKKYLLATEALAALSDCGTLCADIASYFANTEQQNRRSELHQDIARIECLLPSLHSGLLSFFDRIQLLPDCGAVSEFDRVAVFAQSLGLSVPDKRKPNLRVAASLSDAICNLRAAETAEIERIFEKHAEADLREPLALIPDLRFFLEIFAFLRKADAIGIPHCIPTVSDAPVYTAKNAYDVSLLAKNRERIVPNDIVFSEKEPFFFLIGANGGGKTTYLRAVGINLLFFRAGCPVFAEEATIFPFSYAASHFPTDERFDRVGRLDEERLRMREILAQAENQTAFLLLNETFSGTDEHRGFELLKSTSESVRSAAHFCLYVTHFHEVMTTDFPILAAEVDSCGENRRTYRIVKAKGTPSSYAADILKKYRLDAESLKQRRNEREHQSVT